jgi:hypothetical protein
MGEVILKPRTSEFSEFIYSRAGDLILFNVTANNRPRFYCVRNELQEEILNGDS